MPVARYSALFLIAFLVSPMMVMAGEYEFTWAAGTDYASIAAQNTFYVGDVLGFRYDISANDIIIGTDGDAFDQCQMTPNFGHHQSGDDSFTLDQPGNYYFMCEYHCTSDGMKMAVFVNQSYQTNIHEFPL